VEQRNTAIVVCSDAGFLPAACCQLLSTAQHVPGPDAARLFLVCCDVGEADLAEARRFFGARGIDVTLTVPDCAESIEPIETRWPRAAYLRSYFDVVRRDGLRLARHACRSDDRGVDPGSCR
jgi:hypothetical protein